MTEPTPGSKTSKHNTQNSNKAGVSDDPSNYDALTKGKRPMKDSDVPGSRPRSSSIGSERDYRSAKETSPKLGPTDLDEGEVEDNSCSEPWAELTKFDNTPINTSYDGTIEDVIRNFPAARNPADIPKDHKTFHKRRLVALKLDLLQDMFDHPLHFVSINGELEGFALKKDIFSMLMNKLDSKTMQAHRALQCAGEGLPGLPNWGSSGKIYFFYSPTDFEIIATCFRKEVEDLLLLLGSNYKFSESKPMTSIVYSTTTVEPMDNNVPPPISKKAFLRF
ncbi:hypothetical protein BDQ17DRAFT_1422496 [Cyathus striatus]|nr:hypothetical protein BDQ17DRAFT_1422496 [Cyathus striatus]